jgi:membrane protein DedA with SNARE-associated domain
MRFQQDRTWLPVALIAVAVAVWGFLLALGAYLESGADEPHHDPRRFWIVLICVTVFLAGWGLAWWRRFKRPKR